jgi:pyridoxine 5-phosphate synthase
MTRLSVNVNKIATLRNTRTIGIPDVVRAARLCLEAGAHGITVHPRPDQRHIRPADVTAVAELLRSYPAAEYNIEGNPYDAYMDHAQAVRPAQCTLVPDAPEAFTSDHGWDLRDERAIERLKPIVASLKRLGCRVSLFMDAVPGWIELVPRTGADRIELYTEPYARAVAAADSAGAATLLETYGECARRARISGLGVNAGHDLNRDNLPEFLARVPGVNEVSIGHALIADALELGLGPTVQRYLEILERAQRGTARD